MTLVEKLIEDKAILCPYCGVPWEHIGWGEDEYGYHAQFKCPNPECVMNEGRKIN